MDNILKNPPLLLVISFTAIIFIGSISLWIIQFSLGNPMSFVDAVFTSTSAVTVTGLTVINTATLPLLSKITILLLIQLGGLGIMTAFAFFLVILRRRFGFVAQQVMRDILDRDFFTEVKQLTGFIVVSTICIETIGTVLFFVRFSGSMNFGKALFYSVFHSVSAFCNAGFMLFQDGFIRFQEDVYINVVTATLIILGGLGFTTFLAFKTRIFDIFERKIPKKRIDLTTKIVVFSTVVLVIFGTLALYLLEINNTEIHGEKARLLVSFFQSVSARTAGFNTIDPSSLTAASRLLLTALMFTGAASGSTSGGIKITTLFIIILGIFSFLKSEENTRIWGRTVELSNILKAFSILVISALTVISFTIILAVFENVELGKLIFEVVSAFGTVGFSVGITERSSDIGKALFTALMFLGRIGPLTLFFIYTIRKFSARVPKIKYPKERVIVG